MHTIVGLVVSGLGAALVPGIKGVGRDEAVLVPVRWPACQRDIGIAWAEGRYMTPSSRVSAKL